MKQRKTKVYERLNGLFFSSDSRNDMIAKVAKVAMISRRLD